MSGTSQDVNLSRLDVDNAPAILSIRLIETNGEVKLLSSTTTGTGANGIFKHETRIFTYRLGKRREEPSRLFTFTQLLPVSPLWDMVSRPNGSHLGVLESAGGAINALITEDTNGKKSIVTREHATESFSSPRFVRRAQGESAPAISTICDHKHLVVFRAESTADYGKYRTIGGWDDAVLIRCSGGYVIIGKRIVPGPVRDNVMPGIIHFGKLDNSFRPKGTMSKPFGDRPVFEFDGDLIPGKDAEERFVLCATAEFAAHLVVITSSSEVLDSIPVTGRYTADNLTRPTVVATRSHIHLALIEAIRSEGARVLVGSTVARRVED